MAYTKPTLWNPILDLRPEAAKQRVADAQLEAQQLNNQRLGAALDADEETAALAARLSGQDKPEAPPALGSFLLQPMKQMTPGDYLAGTNPFYTGEELRADAAQQTAFRNQQRKAVQDKGQPSGGSSGSSAKGNGMEMPTIMAPDDGQRIGGKAGVNHRLQQWEQKKTQDFEDFFAAPKPERRALGGSVLPGQKYIVGDLPKHILMDAGATAYEAGEALALPQERQMEVLGNIMQRTDSARSQAKAVRDDITTGLKPGALEEWNNQPRPELLVTPSGAKPVGTQGPEVITPTEPGVILPHPRSVAEVQPLRSPSKPPPFSGADSAFYVKPEQANPTGKPEGISQTLWNNYLRSPAALQDKLADTRSEQHYQRHQQDAERHYQRSRKDAQTDREAEEQAESSRWDSVAEAMTEGGQLLTPADISLIRNTKGAKAKQSVMDTLSRLRLQEREEKTKEAERNRKPVGWTVDVGNGMSVYGVDKNVMGSMPKEQQAPAQERMVIMPIGDTGEGIEVLQRGDGTIDIPAGAKRYRRQGLGPIEKPQWVPAQETGGKIKVITPESRILDWDSRYALPNGFQPVPLAGAPQPSGTAAPAAQPQQAAPNKAKNDAYYNKR